MVKKDFAGERDGGRGKLGDDSLSAFLRFCEARSQRLAAWEAAARSVVWGRCPVAGEDGGQLPVPRSRSIRQ